MTIDEVEKIYKAITNEGTPCPRYCMLPCDKCVQECKQVLEWLEELKAYRTFDKTNFSDGYNKAIDDFVSKLKAKCDGMIRDKWNSNVAPISWAEAYADFKDDIEEIAEQLKAGGENEDCM